MIGFWRYNDLLALLLVFVLFGNCWSLNDEGLALLKFRERVVSDPFGALANWRTDGVHVLNPCSWHGIECSNGNVVSLNLGGMCIKGTLGPELGMLIHIKSIILRDNLFSGTIPVEIAQLKELETLDLGCNNFIGPVPYDDLRSIVSLSILLLDHNKYVNCVPPEICEQQLQMVSESQSDDDTSSCRKNSCLRTVSSYRDVTQRKLLQDVSDPGIPKNVETFLPPVASPDGPSAPPPTPSVSSPPTISPPLDGGNNPSIIPPTLPPITPESKPPIVLERSSNSSDRRSLILYSTLGGFALLLILVTGVFFWRSNKLAVVNPWATGISGQLQRAFVTGVPKLGRTELETACEDFSNVIGSSAVGTLYKGTLSSGVEIAVMSFSVSSFKDWSINQEKQFRKKIQTLSELNHKNSVNLLGYCEEDEPFTRMMVFEYAPNGTLFEHLHIKEVEPLDWATRMRIVMGIAYCLEYMHEMKPPITHKKLSSSAVYLTEDFAAKVSDFGIFSHAGAAADMEANPAHNVYSFGVLLLEIVTGKLPYSVVDSVLKDWTSDYLNGIRPVTEMADPVLNNLEVQQLEKISEVIRSCVNLDQRRRPGMKEVTVILREITSIGPDKAIPRLSPLWWAELEIMSAEAS